jgi:hypothetical protein
MRCRFFLLGCLLLPALGWSQSSSTGVQRGGPAPAAPGVQPAVIVQLPPNSPNGGVRAAPRPPQVAPVSPGQDTYSSTGAVPASSSSTTYSSSGRVQSNSDCVRGGVVRKCN